MRHSSAWVSSDVNVAAALIARNDGARRLDHELLESWSSKVVRAETPGRGYGLVAVEEIVQGEWIGVCKALASIYEDELPVPNEQLKVLSGEERTRCLHSALAQELVCRLHSPSTSSSSVARKAKLIQTLFSLYDGSRSGYGVELRDAKRLGLDADGLATLPDELLDPMSSEGVAKVLSIDKQRFLGMLGVNSDDIWCFVSSSDGSRRRRRAEGTAIFGQPAWLNHAFDANVVVTTICDCILLRATRAISKGEELTRSYTTWTWDQDDLAEKLGRFGIGLDPSMRESARLFPAAAVQHSRWASLCKLLASVEAEISSRSSTQISACIGILHRTRRDWAPIFEVSHYLELRWRLLLADAQTRERQLASAMESVEHATTLLHSCQAPVSEFGRYCVVFLLLGAGLHHAPPPPEQAPASVHGAWPKAVANLINVAHGLGSAFLGQEVAAFRAWVRCWFGATGPMEPLLDLLTADDSERSCLKILDLNTLD